MQICDDAANKIIANVIDIPFNKSKQNDVQTIIMKQLWKHAIYDTKLCQPSPGIL